MENNDTANGTLILQFALALDRTRACDADGYCVCEAECLAAYDAMARVWGQAVAQSIKTGFLMQPVNRALFAHS